VEKEQEDFNKLLFSQVVFFIVLIKILITKIVLIEMRTFWLSTSWSFLIFFLHTMKILSVLNATMNLPYPVSN
jgi:hypothetical protein